MPETTGGGKGIDRDMKIIPVTIDEKTVLANAAKKYGFTWEKLHSYKKLMNFPQLPAAMPGSRILDDRAIRMCEVEYSGLDRCMEISTAKATERFPFARMQVCKSHFHKFDKCVRSRDHKMVAKVFKWEKPFFAQLESSSQEEYIEDIARRLDYTEYLVQNEPDPTSKIIAERDYMHLKLRYENLTKGAPSADLLQFWKKLQFAPMPTGSPF